MSREPTPQEMAAFQSLGLASNIGIMPVKFNGQDRFAIIIVHDGPQGKFIQLVGILVNDTDEILDPQGNKSVTAPPQDLAKSN